MSSHHRSKITWVQLGRVPFSFQGKAWHSHVPHDPRPVVCRCPVAYPPAPLPSAPSHTPRPPPHHVSFAPSHATCVHLGCAMGYETVRCFHIILGIFDQKNSQNSTSTRLRKGHTTDALNNFLLLGRHPACGISGAMASPPAAT